MRETISDKIMDITDEGKERLLESVVNAETTEELGVAIKSLGIGDVKVPIKSHGSYVNGITMGLTDDNSRVILAFTKEGELDRSWKYPAIETFRDWVKDNVEGEN